MDLRDARFYQGDYGLSFTVFADQPCCARYRDRLIMPINRQAVDVYAIEPGQATRWVVVKTWTEWREHRLRYFVREGPAFPERHRKDIPPRILVEMMSKVA